MRNLSQVCKHWTMFFETPCFYHIFLANFFRSGLHALENVGHSAQDREIKQAAHNALQRGVNFFWPNFSWPHFLDQICTTFFWSGLQVLPGLQALVLFDRPVFKKKNIFFEWICRNLFWINYFLFEWHPLTKERIGFWIDFFQSKLDE